MREEKKCRIFSNRICNECGLCPASENSGFFHEFYEIRNAIEEAEEYGIAVDMGTTTLSAALFRQPDGRIIGRCSMENPQRKYGSDVISRQSYALRGERELAELQHILLQGINKLIERILSTGSIRKDDVRRIIVAGNTTISHLFLGLDVKGISSSPFVPAFYGSRCLTAGEAGLNLGEDVEVYLPSNIGGHVGSDITAGLLNHNLFNVQRCNLYVDIGTNCEIVLTGNGKAVATSVAAGPVFEGGALKKGMAAQAGAIKKVEINHNVAIQTIYEEEPKGICGSGIISALSQMIKSGIMDSYGRIQSREELRAKRVPELICNHILQGREVNDFLISETGDVVITQKDIREVQLAKAAVLSGICLLMDAMGITEKDIEHLYITGNFGNSLEAEDLITAGLIPDFSRSKILFIKDSVINGLIALGINKKLRVKEKEITKAVHCISLADTADFQQSYIEAMNFPVYQR